MGKLPVGGKALQAPDGDRLLLPAEDAEQLALLLLRADAAADGGEGGGLLELGDGSGGIARPDQPDEGGDIDAHRAAVYTFRLLALQTAAGLEDGHVVVVAESHFLKVGRPLLRGLEGHGRAGYLRPLWLPLRPFAREGVSQVSHWSSPQPLNR